MNIKLFIICFLYYQVYSMSLWTCQNKSFGLWSDPKNWTPKQLPLEDVVILNNTNCLPWINSPAKNKDMFLSNIGGVTIDKSQLCLENMYIIGGSLTMWNSSLIINREFVGYNYAVMMSGLIQTKRMKIDNKSYIEFIGSSFLKTEINNNGLIMLDRISKVFIESIINNGNIYLRLPGSALVTKKLIMNGTITLDISDENMFDEKIISCQSCELFDVIDINLKIVQPNIKAKIIIGQSWLGVKLIREKI